MPAPGTEGDGRACRSAGARTDIYKGTRLANDLRIDMLVDNRIIVEIKSVEELHPVHTAQLLTYLKLTNKKLGLLINFNVIQLIEGLERKMNGYLDEGE